MTLRFLTGGLLLFATSTLAAPPSLEVPHAPLMGKPPTLSAAGQDAQGRFLIEATSDPATGAGTVRRRALQISSPGVLASGAVAWDAGARLTGSVSVPPLPATLERRIFTFDGAAGQKATVPFTWQDLSLETRVAFDMAGALPPLEGSGERRLAWLRGERTHEAPGGIERFRLRSSVLGDIRHSTPLIVGPPVATPGGGTHTAFRAAHQGRGTTVYVGANDGMLHAFDAANGAELFAYVPGVLLGALPALADPAYLSRPFVDGAPASADALVGSNWRSVLASGMGMGARGVFALDITDPRQFGQGGGALWEFTEADDAGIGHLRAAPRIASVRIGANASSAPRHFVIVSSGINSLAGNGSGILFLLALDKPPNHPWRAGVNYFAIPTAAAIASMANALSAPALVTSAEGNAVLAYAGDLQGNLWRFDLAQLSAQRIFTAVDEYGKRQPIAHAPAIAFAPGGGYLVLFGTGRYLEQADVSPSSFSQQSVYAIVDQPAAQGREAAGRQALARRTVSGAESRMITGAPVVYAGPGAQRGWYFDLPLSAASGERAAGPVVVSAGTMILDTVQPGPSAGMTARTYVLEAVSSMPVDASGHAGSGGQTAAAIASATLAPALLLPVDVSTGARDPTGGTIATRAFAVLRPDGQGGMVAASPVKVRFRAGRLGWREVANWHELHEAGKK